MAQSGDGPAHGYDDVVGCLGGEGLVQQFKLATTLDSLPLLAELSADEALLEQDLPEAIVIKVDDDKCNGLAGSYLHAGRPGEPPTMTYIGSLSSGIGNTHFGVPGRFGVVSRVAMHKSPGYRARSGPRLADGSYSVSYAYKQMWLPDEESRDTHRHLLLSFATFPELSDLLGLPAFVLRRKGAGGARDPDDNVELDAADAQRAAPVKLFEACQIQLAGSWSHSDQLNAELKSRGFRPPNGKMVSANRSIRLERSGARQGAAAG